MSLSARPMRLIELGGKSFELWQEQGGIGNGDCVLSKGDDGNKYAMLFYDGLLSGKDADLPENLNALKVKLSAKMPIFKIRYKPRDSCQQHQQFLDHAMQLSTAKYTVPVQIES
jgi:hypothetical protein